MKKGLLLTLFLLSILRGVTLAQNIYESIGKKADVLTLSNGKYQEFFTNDTIVRIGTVLLNTKTKEIIDFVTPNDISAFAEADVASRFLSVDPIGRQYPELTPYQFASNTPIMAVDLDGLEAGIDMKFMRWDAELASGKKTAKQIEKEMQYYGAGGVTGGLVVLSTYTGGRTLPLVRPLLLRAGIWALNPVNQQMIVGLGGLTASFIDPDPSQNYPGNLDDVGRATRLIVKNADVEKFIFNTSKFEYVLNTLSTKGKDILDLSKKEIENLAKSNLRFDYFKKIGLETKEKALEFIGNAWETGKHIESKGDYGTNITKQVVKNVDGKATTFNVNFIQREGEKLPEFTGISVPEANKGLQKEIDKLKGKN